MSKWASNSFKPFQLTYDHSQYIKGSDTIQTSDDMHTVHIRHVEHIRWSNSVHCWCKWFYLMNWCEFDSKCPFRLSTHPFKLSSHRQPKTTYMANVHFYANIWWYIRLLWYSCHLAKCMCRTFVYCSIQWILCISSICSELWINWHEKVDQFFFLLMYCCSVWFGCLYLKTFSICQQKYSAHIFRIVWIWIFLEAVTSLLSRLVKKTAYSFPICLCFNVSFPDLNTLFHNVFH